MSNPVTAQSVDSILPFLKTFEVEGFSAGEWSEPEVGGQVPWVEWSEAASHFVKTLYQNGWIEPFDWGSWQETARTFIDSPGLISAADQETLRKLLTTHVRADRFCEGHLLAMFESGHIVTVLRRLQELRAAMPNP